MFTFKRLNRVTIAVILAALAVPIVYAADTSTAPSTTLSISSAISPKYEVIYNAGDENDDDDDDCDNGDDSDDGSRWHNNQENQIVFEDKSPVMPPLPPTIQAPQPFPQWLTDLTGLHTWPGQNPPYIPQAHINLKNLPEVPLRELGACAGVDDRHCAFDCTKCIAPDEVVTCHNLTQTFDDGPGPATVRLLEALPGRTTFFTQGINVVRFPETFRLQHARGHLLASHTWSHGNLAGLSNEQVAAQIQWSIWAMNATAGVIPLYFRPPYGATDNRVRAITRQFGLIGVYWNRDTFDWRVNDGQKTPKQVLDNVRGWLSETDPITREVHGIMLEHDSTEDVVSVGIEVARLLGPQLTIAECFNAAWYQ